ncbi:sensor histidine kinase [Flagellimonas meridianipacifica]|uniref:Histidine kinase n=1 Tax=Flagellimonas meridianipacifica TaxID=1080225 RepID=A0A2T0MBP7_9FLAO|nr:histidine kinase [Allomuricauda pacifica]PRX54921.1 histidine kinase [Allomuricauda pacifica]
MDRNILTDQESWWFIRYKLYHIFFWGFLFYFWAIAVYDSVSTATETLFFSPKGVQYIFIVIIHTLAVWFCLYFLLPRYLYKKQPYKFAIHFVLWVLLVSMVLVGSYFLSSEIIGMPIDYYNYFSGDRSLTNFFTTQALPSSAGTMLLGLSIKLAKNNIQNQRRQELLEKERLQTELQFLRHQLNPHFLFNTINSIFFLIKKQPDKASKSLAKFSELLRYQLYESNVDFIPLSKEINYLENFIALEQLRKKSSLRVIFNQNYEEKEAYLIAPFILLTFVENAFKHVSNEKNTLNWIEIYLSIEDTNTLKFNIINSKPATTDNGTFTAGGIGLENVKRRLNLIYPSIHYLEFQDKKSTFSVSLSLELKSVGSGFNENRIYHAMKKKTI